MDVHQLTYCVAVANTRNVTRASEQRHIAQPRLSRPLQLLEESVGCASLIAHEQTAAANRGWVPLL